jgi:hypothetical protein
MLKPGGRQAVADVVATALFPAEVQQEFALRTGFVDIRMQLQDESHTFVRE